jgi:alanyl-tRNA synthetase
MWSAKTIIDTFIKYYKDKGYEQCKESSLLPPNNDESILFTNSGMCQFKKIFLGLEEPKFKKVFNYQKCVRAGGKHNDFDDVGKDTYHHSLFYMCGIWEFNCEPDSNEYKKNAIANSYDLLVNVYKMDKNRLYATYFGGNDRVPEDTESKNMWLEHLDASHVLPFGKENFWQMANTGPCGPCSEIHYNMSSTMDIAHLVNKDDPLVIELWNNVFMQYNCLENGTIEPLPFKHLDVGFGFERVCTVLQNKTSNYDTDIFRPTFEIIEEMTKTKYDVATKEVQMAYRIIADHIRTIIFSLDCDIIPSCNNRGFVLQKLFKRACHQGCQTLKTKSSFISNLGERVIDNLIVTGWLVTDKKNLIQYVINEEKNKHGDVIWKSVTTFNKLLAKEEKVITKDEYLILTKTRGVTVDVVQMFCKDHGFTVLS